MDSRKRMRKNKGGVIFPVPPNLSEIISVVFNANSSMIWFLLEYFVRAILQKQEREG